MKDYSVKHVRAVQRWQQVGSLALTVQEVADIALEDFELGECVRRDRRKAQPPEPVTKAAPRQTGLVVTEGFIDEIVKVIKNVSDRSAAKGAELERRVELLEQRLDALEKRQDFEKRLAALERTWRVHALDPDREEHVQ